VDKVTLKIQAEAEEAKTFSEVRLYARRIWLAGLGAYVKAGHEGAEYVKELIKTGEQTERKAKKIIDEKVDAANSEIDSVTDEVKGEATKIRGRVEVQLDRIESAFDRRVARALNRIGIASKHDVDTLSAKLDELTALLERVARKQ
jgi:poly(hydroxyalkanoate) granule-associated protein